MLRSRRLPWAVLGMVLAVLALAIFLTALPIRAGIREQMLRREGEVLHAVVMAQLEALRFGDLEEDPADPGTQLTALLNMQNLKGVLGIRLFRADGGFVTSLPGTLWEQDLPSGLRLELAGLRPAGRYVPHSALARQFYPETPSDFERTKETAMLEVYVPLHCSGELELLGSAEFVLDGSAMAEDYAQLDRRMAIQALSVFGLVSLLLGLGLSWAFRRLHRLHGELAEKTRGLLKANSELALAARTTALGAITSHLVHGLRSPLAGLQNLVASAGQSSANLGPEDWAEAQASMKRMQSLIGEVTQVLREHPVESQYEVGYGELQHWVTARTDLLAQSKGVKVRVDCGCDERLDNRSANLVGLILVNLVENAVQATARGGEVCVAIGATARGVLFRVKDQGGGIAETMRHQLFKPVVSEKEGGSGLGLAISWQLAQHLGARLELGESSAAGSIFELEIPRRDVILLVRPGDQASGEGWAPGVAVGHE